jgi:predicted nucleic acid-binding protein
VRIVADTNCVVSGLLWEGSPRRLIERVRDGSITLNATPELVGELALLEPSSVKP